MFVERVYDVNSKMFRFMEENELVDEDEREIFEKFSRNPTDKAQEREMREGNLLKICCDPIISWIRGKLRGLKKKMERLSEELRVFWDFKLFISRFLVRQEDTIEKYEKGRTLSYLIAISSLILAISIEKSSYIIIPLLLLIFASFLSRIRFKLHHDFKEIAENFLLIRNEKSEFTVIFRKAIKFMRELELVNFGLNVYHKYKISRIFLYYQAFNQKRGAPSEIIEKIEASTVEANLGSGFSYQSIKSVFKITCIDLRNLMKRRLIGLINNLEEFMSRELNEDVEGLKNKMRVAFAQSSESSKYFPTINELKNLWSVFVDSKQEICEKIEEKQKKWPLEKFQIIGKKLKALAEDENTSIGEIKAGFHKIKRNFETPNEGDSQNLREKKQINPQESLPDSGTLAIMIRELKTLKKKFQNISMNLDENIIQNRSFLEKMITEAKIHLRYFSELSASSLDELLLWPNPKDKPVHNATQNADFLLGSDQSLFENSADNNRFQDDESKKDEELKKILKIYQIENETNPEENIPQGGYNPRRKPTIKHESNLMKELNLFLEEKRPRIETEIIDFSKKPKASETEKVAESKVRLNLNMFFSAAKNSLFITKEDH